MADGVIFGLQRFSLRDGPGIRTTIFLKGCDMRCAWCHNPEGMRFWPELSYERARCEGCGRCVALCPGAHRMENGTHILLREKCALCGRCVENCESGALRMLGERTSHESVLERALRDRRYYEASGGGITLSGGEPMCQEAFTRALLEGAKTAGLHTALETNGNAPFDAYAALMPLIDLFLLDYKLTDPNAAREYTGNTHFVAHDNLEALAKRGAKIIMRCPVIPGVNDDEAHWVAIAERSRAHPSILGAELMPYHALGVSKARKIGIEPQRTFDTPRAGETERWRERIAALGGRIVYD